MSFGPFLGGKRICLGKTFAENVIRLMLTMITTQFDFAFVNEEYYKRLPLNQLSGADVEFMVRVSTAQL